MKSQALDPQSILTTPQACRILGITRQTLYLWMQNGRLKPWMRSGGFSWLFARKDIEKLKDTKYTRQVGAPRKAKQ